MRKNKKAEDEDFGYLNEEEREWLKKETRAEL